MVLPPVPMATKVHAFGALNPGAIALMSPHDPHSHMHDALGIPHDLHSLMLDSLGVPHGLHSLVPDSLGVPHGLYSLGDALDVLKPLNSKSGNCALA